MSSIERKPESQHSIEFFTVYDTKANTYRDPLPAMNQVELLRSYETFFRKPENQYDPQYTNAEDFQIFKIGQYTRKTGLLEGHRPIHIASLHEIKAVVLGANQGKGIV